MDQSGSDSGVPERERLANKRRVERVLRIDGTGGVVALKSPFGASAVGAVCVLGACWIGGCSGGGNGSKGSGETPDASTTESDGSTADASSGSDSSDATPPMPNCRTGSDGVTNCGAGGSGTESCCTSLEVTGGTYFRTYDPIAADDAGVVLSADGGPTGEADPATVSGFRLDKYLVTVGRFRQFVAAWSGGYYPSSGSGKHAHLNSGQGLENSGSPGTYETGWDATDWNNTADIDPTDGNLACASFATWTKTAASQEKLPINCVTWYESYAFCIWDGGFLPSEAEWEYAAAGGNQLEYPWGNPVAGSSTDPGMNNQYAIYGCDYPNSSGSCTGVANIAPVGTASLGAGHWGQLDLAGEVDEWNLDWYATYAACTDCVQLTTASNRVVRGGDFGSLTTNLLPSFRDSFTPSVRGNLIGFRCARTP